MILPADMSWRRVVKVARTTSITGTERNTLTLECGHVENIPRRQAPPKKRRCVACVAEATASWEGQECGECGDILVANEEGQPTCTCCGRPGPRKESA